MSKSSSKPTKQNGASEKATNGTAVPKRSFAGMHKNIERVSPVIIPGYLTWEDRMKKHSAG